MVSIVIVITTSNKPKNAVVVVNLLCQKWFRNQTILRNVGMRNIFLQYINGTYMKYLKASVSTIVCSF